MGRSERGKCGLYLKKYNKNTKKLAKQKKTRCNPENYHV